jgi:hypothetical protein
MLTACILTTNNPWSRVVDTEYVIENYIRSTKYYYYSAYSTHSRLLFFELAQIEPTKAYYSSLGRGPRPFLASFTLEGAGLRRC